MQPFELMMSDGARLACYAWRVDEPSAVVHIAHGMGEHARRYDEVALALNDAGYAVYANDHRGHGKVGAPGDMGPDGWNRVLADAYELNRHMRVEHPGLQLALLGHSMGAMLTQQYLTRYPASVDAVVLSGSPGFKKPSANRLSRLLARFEAWRLGPGAPSTFMQKLVFGNANKAFDGPSASGFEWLSRDAVQVAKYVEDDECGFVLCAASLADLFEGSIRAQDPLALARIQSDLPMYVFSGSDDPVHGGEQDFQRMVLAYRNAGLARLDHRLYPGGRHEMFNETNRQEVIDDLIAWLNTTLR